MQLFTEQITLDLNCEIFVTDKLITVTGTHFKHRAVSWRFASRYEMNDWRKPFVAHLTFALLSLDVLSANVDADRPPQACRMESTKP